MTLTFLEEHGPAPDDSVDDAADDETGDVKKSEAFVGTWDGGLLGSAPLGFRALGFACFEVGF